jgi:arsenate reductase
MRESLTVYSYSGCSTCRQALRFLKTNEVSHSVHEITEMPPSAAQLTKALAAVGGDLRKLFNTSGQQYRELGIAAKLKTMTPDEAIRLLASNGKLIKRPFAMWTERGVDKVLIGFKEDEWSSALL